ncbi:MAG: SRPBCC family protein [Bacillota bacterium]
MSNIILKKTILNCDIKYAFSLFTKNELLTKWLCEKADVQAEIGGKYELSWSSECGPDNGTFGCRITCFEESKVLAFDWKGPAEFENVMNNADPLTHVVVSFIPTNISEKKYTEVILVHSGWKLTDDWEKARQWFDRAWDFAFKALVKAAED